MKQINLTLILLLLWAISSTQSCKKDLKLVNKGQTKSQTGQDLSIEEAKQFFENKIAKTIPRAANPNSYEIAPNLSDKKLIWENAINRMFVEGNIAVLIPLNRENTYTNISDSLMVKFGYLNYIRMYKDSTNTIISDWVEMLPSLKWVTATGYRKYDGKVILKTLNGKVKKIYTFSDGVELNNSTAAVARRGASVEGIKTPPDNPSQTCVYGGYTIYTSGTTCPCEGHSWDQRNSCRCNVGPTSGSTRFVERKTCEDDDPIEPKGTSSIGGSSSGPIAGGSGLGSPIDVMPPDCLPDHMAGSTPAPQGMELAILCSGKVIPVELIHTPTGKYTPKEALLKIFSYYNLLVPNTNPLTDKQNKLLLSYIQQGVDYDIERVKFAY